MVRKYDEYSSMINRCQVLVWQGEEYKSHKRCKISFQYFMRLSQKLSHVYFARFVSMFLSLSLADNHKSGVPLQMRLEPFTLIYAVFLFT